MISKALIDSYVTQNKCDSVNNILKYNNIWKKKSKVYKLLYQLIK